VSDTAIGQRHLQVPAPLPQITIDLLNLGTLTRLSYGSGSSRPTATVHVLRWWSEEGYADTPLAELGPHQIRDNALYIPAGLLGWAMCGPCLDLSISCEARPTEDPIDDLLCPKCLDLLGDVHRLLAFQ
jgi:hypothetical protein